MDFCFTFLLFGAFTPSMYDESDWILDGGEAAFLWIVPSEGIFGAVGSSEVSNVFV